MPSEKTLLTSFLEIARRECPGAVIFKWADMFNVGVPDVIFTMNLFTTFLEFKFADPDFSSKGIQELTMLRLATQSHHARYVIYEKLGRKEKRTYIVHPKDFANWKTRFSFVFEGFDHQSIVNYLRKIHHVE